MSKFRNSSLLQPGENVTDDALLTEMNILASERRINQISRRNFLATTSLAAGAAGTLALTGCSTGSNTGLLTPPTTTTAPTVSDILNFALNLEYLEATFYLTLTTGTGLPAALQGTSPGAVTGSLAQVTFVDPGVQDLANQLAADELAHVTFLRATMQSLSLTPVDMPALNLAALGAITTDAQFLAIARQLEATGVSAYEGAIGGLVSNVAALNYAAVIHDTEGQHEGALRQYCIANGVTSGAIDSADVPPTATTIFNTNGTTGLNTARSTSQVLMIAYANTAAGITSGGFYPNGVNGNIKST
ncbi:ferritin-like domain-containing protein [Acidipila sp. EB88]|uniref:ferritin-like domain-containing protein n=1 Tax=Acidipila sp. EB88 TaxID=2305226 RepID=UPI000F5DCF0E|nr:ferritin-like domain-containing protein [Acidipila sp. EB88]RRA49090.1 ferritin-like domain-containing protein [Acidipila sp. EB88]